MSESLSKQWHGTLSDVSNLGGIRTEPWEGGGRLGGWSQALGLYAVAPSRVPWSPYENGSVGSIEEPSASVTVGVIALAAASVLYVVWAFV